MNALVTTPTQGQLDTRTPLRDDDAMRVADAIGASAAANTVRVYGAQWRKFVRWCTERGYDALPASPEAVAAYLSAIANSNSRYVVRAAIRSGHRIANMTDPTGSEVVAKAAKGAGRLAAAAGERERKALPLSLEDLNKIAMHLDAATDARSARDACLLLCGWWSACRRSELAAWRVEDVTFTADGATVFIPQSKTDQTAEGQRIFLPTGAASRLKAFIGKRATGFVFCGDGYLRHNPQRGGAVERCIQGRDVARILKARAGQAGIENANRLSGHSLRRGFVTDRRRRGAALADIAEQTRHKSLDTLRGYDDAQSASVKRLLSL